METMRAPIWYVYPMWKKVSFSLISRKHLKYLRKLMRVEEIDELTLPCMEVASSPLVLLHPYFYPMDAFAKHLAHRLPRLHGLIGLDVADSDRLSQHAVELANEATAMIVPSNFAKRAYESSGVRVPIHVLHHGVEPEFVNRPRRQNPFPVALRDLRRRRLKILLAYIVHSEYRKGEDLLMEIYRRLKAERKDVALAIKDNWGVRLADDRQKRIFSGWLGERQQMDLYDNADLFLLTSRGGGFELPGLEALARGVPVIAARGGAWEDYMPEWGLVPSRRCPHVFEGNSIHVGGGVEMILEKAVEKAHEILDNLDEYRARAQEYARTRIARDFTWPRIAEELKDIIARYASG
ncbi:MAG: hypothetical protein DRP01_01975 [Archaeoglobales archaeon]|nr:MAG: hypothetical protein DRP01_01975 [Archaeoglobales archaeon]